MIRSCMSLRSLTSSDLFHRALIGARLLILWMHQIMKLPLWDRRPVIWQEILVFPKWLPKDHCRLENFFFIKPVSQNWIETCTNVSTDVLSGVLCTFGCTLYFHVRKYKVHPKVHQNVGINIFSTGSTKRVQSTSESIFMYCWLYSVLFLVLCTFKKSTGCTLKSTRCTLKSTRCTLKSTSKKQGRYD
jgi:hypothetical protein